MLQKKTLVTIPPLATLLALLLVAAGCASSASDGPAVSAPNAGGARLRSPAEERVISGVAEIVLTDRAWPNFETAAANRIDAVADGSPLFVHIRASRPLQELAHPANASGQAAYLRHPHLFLQIGDTESMRILNTCYVTLQSEEARRNEMVVSLAPATRRPGDVPTDCFLASVSGQRGSRLRQEIRLAGFAGKFESWLPVPDILAVAPLELDLSNGPASYSSMLRAPARAATAAAGASAGSALARPGSPGSAAVASPVSGGTLPGAGAQANPPRSADSPLPAHGSLGGSRLEAQLQALATAALGRRPAQAYFIDDRWSAVIDPRGRMSAEQAYAAVVFQGSTCSWSRIRVLRRPGSANLADVERTGESREIPCSALR